MTDCINWYALKVFYNKTLALRDNLAGLGFECYCPLGESGKPLVSSLLFVHCSERSLLEYRQSSAADIAFSIYTREETRPGRISGQPFRTEVPAPIPDREMEVFILVTSAAPGTVEVLGPDHPKYHTGQKVRVAEGLFAGSEGYVRRIRKDRRLVITITGVVAIATIHIDPAYLVPVNEDEHPDGEKQ